VGKRCRGGKKKRKREGFIPSGKELELRYRVVSIIKKKNEIERIYRRSTKTKKH
jgi:hypothetical protein